MSERIIMTRHICALLLCLAASGFAFGQDSRADLFAGYSYVNIDTNELSSRQNANGWELAVTGFNKWLAVEGDGSGYYKSFGVNVAVNEFETASATAKVTDYSYAAGPRINLRPVFIHVLFGGDYLTGSVSGVSASQDGLAALAGGGVQFKIAGPWGVRALADYAYTQHNIFGGSAATQNNVRASIGIVYSFGRRTTPEPPASTPRSIHSEAPTSAGIKIAALGAIVTLGRNTGAEITDLSPNGSGAIAGLHVGDVINAVDGKPIQTPTELAAELSSRGDKVRLGYLLRGNWQSEAVIVLAH
jgi:hypothetical protein